MKKSFSSLLIILALLMPVLSIAQIDYALEPAAPDTSTPLYIPKYERVMIIPFDMTYYLSDADHEIAKANKQSLKEVQQAFRYGLDMTMGAVVEETYATKRILLDTIPEANKDLNKLYGAISWRYSRAKVIGKPNASDDDRKHTEQERGFGSRFKAALGIEDDALTETGGDTQFAKGTVTGPAEGQRFMHAELRHPEVLKEIYQIYQTDLFLFINQFELKTNYEHCLDRATSNYVREASIHYSLYDVNGRFIDGNVFTVQFDSKSRKLQDIISENFPQLCMAAAGGLPNPKMVKNKRD